MSKKLGKKIADPYGATRRRDADPARSAIKPNAFSRQGSFASFKNGFAQQYESGLERACLEWLEVNPRVLRYQTQPMKLQYRARGKERFATPDIRVETSGGAIIINVKPLAHLEKEKNQIKLREVGQAVNRLGFAYKVFSEREIYAEPQRATVKELCYWQWFPLPDGTRDALDSLAAEGRAFTLEQLIHQFGSLDDNEAVSRAYMLMAQGYVAFDFKEPLSPQLMLMRRDFA